MSDQWRNRILNWESSAPPGTWENIAISLDELNAEKKLSDKLLVYEVVPPEEIQGLIIQHITDAEKIEKPAAPVIPMQPLYPFLIRYGAVAVCIGLIAWVLSGNLFWNRKAEGNVVGNEAVVNIAPAAKEPVNSISAAVTGNDQSVVEEKIAEANFSNDAPAKNIKYAVVRQVVSPAKILSPGILSERMLHTPFKRLRELPVQKRNLRYILIPVSAGNAVKLSAKFAPLYYKLVEDPQALPAKTPARSLLKMQERLFSQPLLPNPNSHLDLLRLIELLQQEQ
jgi:hypothetical protein